MSEAGSDGIMYLRTRLEENIEQAETRRTDNRRLALRAKMALATLAIATTILIGLSQNNMFSPWRDILSASAFVISSSTAIITTWDGFYDFRWLWIQYTDHVAKLRDILEDLNYACQCGPLTAEELDQLYGRFQDSMQSAHATWFGKRERENRPEGRHAT